MTLRKSWLMGAALAAALPLHAEEVRLKSGVRADLSSAALVTAPEKFGGIAAGNTLELTYTVSGSGYSLRQDAQSLCRVNWSKHFNSTKAKLTATQLNSGIRLIDTNAPLVAVKVTFQKAPASGSHFAVGVSQWMDMRGLNKCRLQS
ncbi:hypothetical protein N6L27_16710 [Leisingera sp. SS27]|uniref:hypothetical protein n=1 Tax=Leisingera sp. SS27 TaxID=2979462 RepID=UPI00232FBD58|nr:hypothetical protein [Leisingera sp. SS27]MDC0659645.1 hypothetical protein [Leisingera sp. SS27]